MGAFLSYVELLFLFSILYAGCNVLVPGSFNECVNTANRAFAVSMTTMTTVGFGRIAPESGWAVGIATWQALLAILMITVFVSSIIARERGRAETGTAPAGQQCGSGSYTPLAIVVVLVVVFALLRTRLA